MKRYVAGLMFSENRESLTLIIKNKPDWQKGLMNGIGGKIEPEDYLYLVGDKEKYLEDFEASHNAMVREFEEETGVFHEDWELFLQLSGGGNENADQTNGKIQQYKEGWSVDFYRTFSNKCYDCKTFEDEEIRILSVVDALCSSTIENLKWIILLSLDKNPKITKSEY